MAYKRGVQNGAVFTAVTSVVFVATAAFSQQAEAPAAKPPPRLVFSLKTGVNADSNRSMLIGTPDRATTLDTDFGLTYARRTKLQSLDASVGALWRLGKTGLSANLEPRASLSYSYNDGDTKLTFDSKYRKLPVTLLEPFTGANGTISPTDVTAVTGSVSAWDNRLSAQTGMRNWVGFLFSASTSGRHYLHNTDPNVFDSHSKSLNGTLQLRPDSISEFDLTRGYTSTRYDNALKTDQKQNQVSLGYQRALSPVLTLNARIDRNHDNIGPSNVLEAGGSLVTPTGKLDAQGGVSDRPGYGKQLIGLLRYATTGPVNSFTATVSRQMVFDAENNDVAYARLELDYTHKISSVSNVSLGIVASHVGKGVLGTGTPTDWRSFSLVYTRQVTTDWALNTGYLLRHLQQSGEGTATSNSFFVTLGRKFTVWP